MATIAPLLLSTTTRILSRTTTTLAPIQIVTIRLNYYASIIILIIGFFGCLCNFITFTAPQLRSNSCAFYFLIAAIFELFSISFGLISRLATENLGSNLVHTNQAFCKLRAYLVSAIPLVATYLVLLASIDRCLSSSVNARLRSFSRMKVAYRAMLVAAVIAFSSCSHILVSYDLRPRCSTKPGDYAKFDGLFVVFWLGVIPHGLMLLFGSLTFWNVRQNKRRVNAQTTSASVGIQSNQIREQKRQRQLMIVSRAFHVETVSIENGEENTWLNILFLHRWCSFKSVSALFSSWLVWSTMLIPFSDHHWPATTVWSPIFCRRSLLCCTISTMPSRSISTRCRVNCFDRSLFIESSRLSERYWALTRQHYFKSA